MLYILLFSIIIGSVLWYHNAKFLIVFLDFSISMKRPLTYRIFASAKQETDAHGADLASATAEGTQNFIELKPLKNRVGKHD